MRRYSTPRPGKSCWHGYYGAGGVEISRSSCGLRVLRASSPPAPGRRRHETVNAWKRKVSNRTVPSWRLRSEVQGSAPRRPKAPDPPENAGASPGVVGLLTAGWPRCRQSGPRRAAGSTSLLVDRKPLLPAHIVRHGPPDDFCSGRIRQTNGLSLVFMASSLRQDRHFQGPASSAFPPSLPAQQRITYGCPHRQRRRFSPATPRLNTDAHRIGLRQKDHRWSTRQQNEAPVDTARPDGDAASQTAGA
jgi:hypothetical protein